MRFGKRMAFQSPKGGHMSCERCVQLEYYIEKFKILLEETTQKYITNRDQVGKSEGEISRLKTYEDQFKKSYDKYVTNPNPEDE